MALAATGSALFSYALARFCETHDDKKFDMVSWIVRIVLFLASIVTGWFVARDADNFGVIQMAVSLLLIIFFIALAAFWPSVATWFRNRREAGE